jgi:uracil-DNA glycosylase
MMDTNSWYIDYVARIVDCPTCRDEIKSLYPDVTECYPESLCYLPSQNVKLMIIAEAPGLGPKNDGVQKNRQSALDWMKLDAQWQYLSGQNVDFKSDSYGSFVFNVIQGLKKEGYLIKPNEIAVTNCIKYPIPRTHSSDSNKKVSIAAIHQATHLSEEFQYCRPKVVVALGSTAIQTVTKLHSSGKIFFNSLVKLPHPAGSHPAGRWHYEAYDLFDPLVHHFIKLLS